MYVRICKCRYVYIGMYKRMYECVCVCVYMYVCLLHVYIDVCMYICMYGNGLEPDEVDDGMGGHHDTLVRLLAIHGEILHEISHVLRETKIENYFYIHTYPYGLPDTNIQKVRTCIDK